MPNLRSKDPGMGFSIQILPPPQQVAFNLMNAAAYITNWRGAWWGIARAFYAMEKRAFATQGSSTGKRWRKLDDRYAAWKQLHAPGKGILELTGDLRKSLTQRNPQRGGAVYESTPIYMAIGTDLATKSGYGLGRLHQEGKGHLKVREPLRVDEKFMVATREIMTMHTVRSLSKATGRMLVTPARGVAALNFWGVVR